MLKLCRVTKVKVFFLVLVYVFNFDLFEISAAILEKSLLERRSLKKSGLQRDTPYIFSNYTTLKNKLFCVVIKLNEDLFTGKGNLTKMLLQSE